MPEFHGKFGVNLDAMKIMHTHTPLPLYTVTCILPSVFSAGAQGFTSIGSQERTGKPAPVVSLAAAHFLHQLSAVR